MLYRLYWIAGLCVRQQHIGGIFRVPILKTVAKIEAVFLAVLICTLVVAANAGQKRQSSDPSAPAFGEQTTDTASLRSRAWEALTDGIQDKSDGKRRAALGALATIGKDRQAAQLVESGLEDKDAAVRQVSASMLGCMQAKSSIKKLKQAMREGPSAVSFAAAESLWQMGDRSGRDLFAAVLARETTPSDGMVKSNLLSAKKTLQHPKELAKLGTKQAAGAFLGPFSMGITVAEEATKDRGATARAQSALLLGNDATPAAVQQLGDALNDKNWTVRTAAARALADTRQKDQVSKLAPLLHDDKPAVRFMAAASIIRLTKPVTASTATACEIEF